MDMSAALRDIMAGRPYVVASVLDDEVSYVRKTCLNDILSQLQTYRSTMTQPAQILHRDVKVAT